MATRVESQGAPLELSTDAGVDGSLVVTVEGEVDLSNAARLGEALTEAMRTSASGTVAVDLAGLRFIDSSGLRQLLLAGRAHRRDGHRLTITNAPDEFRRLFELTALDKSIDVLPRSAS
jgi:anti-sigma B factor antagonist